MKDLLIITAVFFFTVTANAQHWSENQFIPDSSSAIYSATTGSEFGWWMSATDDHVIVGTLQGEAVIYQRTKIGGSLLTQALLEPTGGGGGFIGFGMRVDIDDTTAVVGAPLYMNTGAVFVYTFNGGTQNWSLQQVLEPSDGGTNDRFGEAVAISGNNILVGARGHNSNEGAAYLFNRVGLVWAEADKFTPADANSGDQFGTSVDLVGDTAVCTSPSHYNGIVGYSGAAYILAITGGTVSLLQTVIAAADQWSHNDNFGANGACISETGQVFIGANRSDVSGVDDAGAVFGWYLDGGGWSPFKPLIADNPESNEGFGTSISTKNGKIAIGAPNYNSFAGRVVLGILMPDLYFQIQSIVANSLGFGPAFGQSTAFIQHSFLGGANYGNTYYGGTDTGKVTEHVECDEEIDGNIFWDGTILESQEGLANAYYWYKIDDSTFPFPVPTLVGTSSLYEPTTPGRYVLKIEKNGCFLTSVIVVTTVGVEEVTRQAFSIQPNPVTDILSFTCQLNSGLVEVYSSDGQLLKSETLVGQNSVDVSDLAEGVYTLRITGSKGIGQQRFVKIQ